MSLKNLLFWNTQNLPDPLVHPIQANKKDAFKQDALSNVINLPTANPLEQPVGLASQEDLPKTEKQTYLGVLDSIELKQFFEQNHFGLGRHNGSVYRTQNSLELGKKNIISDFQNILSELYERNRVKKQRLHLKSIETFALCDTTSSMLEYVIESTQKDMDLLSEQRRLADDCRGWVLKALNSYQIGFGKGVREAIDFDLI